MMYFHNFFLVFPPLVERKLKPERFDGTKMGTNLLLFCVVLRHGRRFYAGVLSF